MFERHCGGVEVGAYHTAGEGYADAAPVGGEGVVVFLADVGVEGVFGPYRLYCGAYVDEVEAFVYDGVSSGFSYLYRLVDEHAVAVGAGYPFPVGGEGVFGDVGGGEGFWGNVYDACGSLLCLACGGWLLQGFGYVTPFVVHAWGCSDGCGGDGEAGCRQQ